jgi:phosphoglycerol transferase MdoB-like AlkP superfamily enzyme
MDTGALCDALNSPNYQPPKLSPTACGAIAVALHYLYAMHFLTLFVEALHNYTLYTYVYVRRPMLNRHVQVPLLLVAPVVAVAPTAVFLFTSYTNFDTCWVALSSTNMIIETAAIILLAALAIILCEATPMRNFKPHPQTDETLRTAAGRSARAGLGITILSAGE